jgi:putrescine aminotransferase
VADTFRRVRAHFTPAVGMVGKVMGSGTLEVTGAGSRVRRSDGREVLDFGSYAVTLLGRGDPVIRAAVRRQLDDLPVSTRCLANEVTPAAAEALVDYLGGPWRRVYFGANGSDAVEVALKLARIATGRTVVVAVEGAFHGKTLGALAATHEPRFRRGLDSLLAPAVIHVPPDDPDAVARIAADVPLAAVIVEVIQGENGVRPLDTAVLRRWCSDAHAAEAFVISDEIQMGLRRCGERCLCAADGLEADAVLLGKALGGGMVPLSAAVCTDRLYQPLLDDPYLHTATFSGMPLCTAALQPCLERIEDFRDNGHSIATLMTAALSDLAARHDRVVTAVRGRGLAWGLDLVDAPAAGRVYLGLAAAGLLVSPCLSRPTTLRMLPPITATVGEVGEAMELLDGVLGAARTEE